MAEVCRIPRLKCDLNFGLPVLSVLGIINSLWAYSFFLNALDEVIYIHRRPVDEFLIGPIQNTYYLLGCSVAVMLYYGFKTSNKSLIQYWYLLKFLECGFVIAGVLLFATSRYEWPKSFFAIPVLGVGWYVTTAVRQGCCELGLEEVSISNILTNFKSPINDEPPAYDTVENSEKNRNIQV